MFSRFRSALFAWAALAGLALAPQAFAADTLVTVRGNPTCADVQAQAATLCPLVAFPTEPISELKVDGTSLAGGGLFSDGTLRVDVDALPDANGRVTTIDWDDVSFGGPVSVAAVVVKAGNSANIYCHAPIPPAEGDTGLTGPGSTKLKSISHVSWCYPTTLRTCPVDELGVTAICDVLPLGTDYFFTEQTGPSTSTGPIGICLCTASTTIEECDPDLPAGTAGACGTLLPFQGQDSISLGTSGLGTCDRVCKTISGRRRCFELCF